MLCEALISISLLSSVFGTETTANPVLTFSPRPNPFSTNIHFNTALPSTFEPYTTTLEEVLSEYSTERQLELGDIDDCASVRGYRSPDQWVNPCRFDLFDLGPECVKQRAFGYEDGQPCVLFNMEKLLSWLPVPYDNSSVPETIRDLWSQYSVTLKCEGADPASRANLGTVLYYPTHGFAFKYYPYLVQRAWKSPLAFAMFENPTPNIRIRVVCKVYAANINHSRILDTSMVNFELFVE